MEAQASGSYPAAADHIATVLWKCRLVAAIQQLYKSCIEAKQNEQISRNPRRVAHCRVSSLVMVCRRSFAAKANLLAILLTRRQQSADHNRDKVCQVGVTVNTSSLVAIALGFHRLFLEMSTHPQSCPKV